MVQSGGWRTSVRSATVHASPEIAAEGEGLDDVPGDIAAEVSEVPHMPTVLPGHEGGLAAYDGKDLCEEMFDLLRRRLPQLAADDPYRQAISCFLVELGPRLGRDRLSVVPAAPA